MSAGKLAALGADGLWIEDELVPRRPTWENQRSVGALFEAMRRFGIGIMHLHASALPLLGLPELVPVPAEGERRPHHPWMRAAGKLSTRALAPSVECDGLELMIGAYQGGWGDPFADAADARELLRAHVAFMRALATKEHPRGWAYRNSAALTGWQLMHAPWKHGPRAARLKAMDTGTSPLKLKGLDVGAQVEVPFGSRWVRKQTKRPTHPVVSAWDVNGQRLSACARLSLGLGEAELRRSGEPFDRKLPGYHYVTKITDPFRGKIPAPFERGWHTTPRVAMADYLGISFKITHSWVWPEHLPYLNPWYERMRDARAELRAQLVTFQGAHGPNVGGQGHAVALALDALKQCYLQPLGRLRSARSRERREPFYRPHWYDAVIGQELAREYLRLHALATEGVRVLAVYFDTIIIEGESAEPPPSLPVSDQLGKYKLVGSLPSELAHELLYTENGTNVPALIAGMKAGVEAASVRAGRIVATRVTTRTRPAHGGYPNG